MSLLIAQQRRGLRLPGGTPTIDWTNPLTAGLVGCYVVTGEFSNQIIRDLVTNTILTKAAGASVIRAGAAGMIASDVIAGGWSGTMPANQKVSLGYGPPDSQTVWSISWMGQATAASGGSSDPALLFSGRYTNATTSPFVTWGVGRGSNSSLDDTAFGYCYNDSANFLYNFVTGFFNASNNGVYCGVVTFKMGGASKIFKNGNLMNTQTAGTGQTTYGTSPQVAIGCYPTGGDDVIPGVATMLGCIWNRYMNDSEASFLSTEPTAFLRFPGDFPNRTLSGASIKPIFVDYLIPFRTNASIRQDWLEPFGATAAFREDFLEPFSLGGGTRVDWLQRFAANAALRIDTNEPFSLGAGAVKIDGNLPFEALADIRQRNGVPFGTAASIRIDNNEPVTSGGAFRQDWLIPDSILLSVRTDVLVPNEWRFTVRLDENIPITTSGPFRGTDWNIPITTGAPFQGIDFNLPVEWRLQVTQDWVQPVEWRARAMWDAIIPFAAYSTNASDANVPFKSSGAVRPDWNIPFTTFATGSIRIDWRSPTAWTAAIRRDFVEPFTSAAPFSGQYHQPVEWLSNIYREWIQPVAWTSATVRDWLAPIEVKGTVLAFDRVPVEIIGGVSQTWRVPFSLKAQFILDTNQPVYSNNSFRTDTNLPAAWLATTQHDFNVPVETTGDIIRLDNNLPVAWYAGLRTEFAEPIEWLSNIQVQYRQPVYWLYTTRGDSLVPFYVTRMIIGATSVPVELLATSLTDMSVPLTTGGAFLINNNVPFKLSGSFRLDRVSPVAWTDNLIQDWNIPFELPGFFITQDYNVAIEWLTKQQVTYREPFDVTGTLIRTDANVPVEVIGGIAQPTDVPFKSSSGFLAQEQNLPVDWEAPIRPVEYRQPIEIEAAVTRSDDNVPVAWAGATLPQDTNVPAGWTTQFPAQWRQPFDLEAPWRYDIAVPVEALSDIATDPITQLTITAGFQNTYEPCIAWLSTSQRDNRIPIETMGNTFVAPYNVPAAWLATVQDTLTAQLSITGLVRQNSALPTAWLGGIITDLYQPVEVRFATGLSSRVPFKSSTRIQIDEALPFTFGAPVVAGTSNIPIAWLTGTQITDNIPFYLIQAYPFFVDYVIPFETRPFSLQPIAVTINGPRVISAAPTNRDATAPATNRTLTAGAANRRTRTT